MEGVGSAFPASRKSRNIGIHWLQPALRAVEPAASSPCSQVFMSFHIAPLFHRSSLGRAGCIPLQSRIKSTGKPKLMSNREGFYLGASFQMLLATRARNAIGHRVCVCCGPEQTLPLLGSWELECWEPLPNSRVSHKCWRELTKAPLCSGGYKGP